MVAGSMQHEHKYHPTHSTYLGKSIPPMSATRIGRWSRPTWRSSRRMCCRLYPLREVFHALRWIVRTEVPWRLLDSPPTNFPP